MLKDTKVVVGICGGISAYKSADLVSRLRKKGAQVKVIMTKNATEFIAPLTFSSLSADDVIVDMFAETMDQRISHIFLAQWAEYMIIAPATANFIGKAATGIADDLLTTTVMATRAKVIIVPAMNTNMYNNPVLQRNIESLGRYGYTFFGPAEGNLACGDKGTGRMEEPQAIVEYLEGFKARSKDLQDRIVMVTAGPTRESLDPVRFFSNASSGKMGYSIADAAIKRGAQVILISGPTHILPPPSAEFVPVISAMDMYDEVLRRFSSCDVVIKTAAVSDYRPAEVSPQKIKKSADRMSVELVRNPDILLELGNIKKNRILVGFAAESADLIEHAREKLHYKNLDLIVANDITEEGIGFGSDLNGGYIVNAEGEAERLEPMNKSKMADIILDKVVLLLNKGD